MSTGLQKSALFSANAGARRACEESGVRGLPALLVGGLAAGTARTVVETPFELAKVRYQTGGRVQLTELYTGAGATWARGTLMLTSFFVLCDYSEKAAPELMSRPVWKSKFYGAFVLKRRVVLHAINATHLDGVAMPVPRRSTEPGHPTHWLISTQVETAVGRLPEGRCLRDACVGGCVEIKILRRVRAESSRRPLRHRRDACSMAWRCRVVTARRSQDGRVIAEK